MKNKEEEEDIELGSNSLLLDDEHRNGIELYNSQSKIKSREKHTLPPRWVEQEEQIEENLEEINKQLKELEIQLREIKHQSLFSKNEDIPFERVEMANQEIIKLIRTSEYGLKDIMSFKIENPVDDKIRKNVHYWLAIRLKEVTSKAKKLEKKFLTEVRQRFKVEESDANNEYDDSEDEDGMVHMKLHKRAQQARSKEIEEIVNSTNELATLFKELSVLVIEQGTILDRIDAHIEESLQSTKKGHKHLVEAKKASESTRARNVIMWLVISIVIWLVLLIIKNK